MSVGIGPPTGSVIVPDTVDGLPTDVTWWAGQVRAALHREWLPSCRGPWRDDLPAGPAGGAR